MFSVTQEQVGVFPHLDLERLLQLFDDRLSVLQLHAETFSIGDLSPKSRRSHFHGWRVLTHNNITSKQKTKKI